MMNADTSDYKTPQGRRVRSLSRWFKDHAFHIVCFAIIIGVVVLIGFLIQKDSDWQKWCKDNGGHIMKTNHGGNEVCVDSELRILQ